MVANPETSDIAADGSYSCNQHEYWSKILHTYKKLTAVAISFFVYFTYQLF